MLALLLATVGVGQAGSSVKAAELDRHEPVVAACYSAKMARFQAAMQKLWIDHAVWMRKLYCQRKGLFQQSPQGFQYMVKADVSECARGQLFLYKLCYNFLIVTRGAECLSRHIL
ncbi:hypothetical protein [Paenibacillus whitsoniae]|uniref:Uncharacterized protein n=1 Tax=Paenibacillus whitsoniae TaxID=2496558 RepID=A0A3S0CF64_9BACL|nr:hypothetical protein [Paenibacillus whitsoniae]RTE11352.1 hypothetical protein EJQ19_02445 [Paenibacillus whitsoniae]